MISVMIPVYNAEKYLERTVNSVLSQTYEDYEIILVDDNSSDNSLNICEKLALEHSRVKVLALENNGYVGNARNKALKAAEGEYVYFLDSDDVFSSDSVLERVYAEIQKNAPDIICSSLRITENGERLTADIKNTADLFIFSPYVGQSFYKKEILKREFSIERKTAEDCEWLFYNLPNAKTLSVLDISFFTYTSVREGSLTTSFKREFIVPTIDTWISLYEAECKLQDEKRVKRYCANALIEHCIYASQAGMNEQLKRCLPYLKKSKAKYFLPLRFIVGLKGVLWFINLKMRKKLAK